MISKKSSTLLCKKVNLKKVKAPKSNSMHNAIAIIILACVVWGQTIQYCFPWSYPVFSDFRILLIVSNPAVESKYIYRSRCNLKPFSFLLKLHLSESADLCFDLFRCSLGGLCVDMVHWVSWKKPLWVINFAPNWHTHSLEMKSETSKKRKHSKIWHDNLSGEPHSLLYYR